MLQQTAVRVDLTFMLTRITNRNLSQIFMEHGMRSPRS